MAKEFTKGKTSITARTRLLVSFFVGLIALVISGTAVAWRLAPLVGWDISALTYLLMVWTTIWHYDGKLTAEHALREDPSRKMTNALMLIASIASLLAVALVLIGAGDSSGLARQMRIVLAVASVVVSWVVVHTLFMLRYAELFYTLPVGGVDFGETKQPSYKDFAYLAFTIGMTFQVSDTVLMGKGFRSNVLKQALLSYLFGTVILATTINLVAGLSN